MKIWKKLLAVMLCLISSFVMMTPSAYGYDDQTIQEDQTEIGDAVEDDQDEYIKELEQEVARLQHENAELNAEVSSLQKIIDETPECGDLNDDGVIDILDSIVILRYLAEFDEIKELPYRGTVTPRQ